MESNFFTGRAEIRYLIKSLRDEAKAEAWQFSDLVDDEGNQYVDLVLQGGGVLGLALVGYTYVLEELGIRFLRIAGTSAGAISALLLGALDTPSKAKSAKVAEYLATLRIDRFLDGGPASQAFLRSALARSGKVNLFLKGLRVYDKLQQRLGLNPGQALENWMRSVLDENGVSSTALLQERFNNIHQFRHRMGRDLLPGQTQGRLALIAADVSTETKVEFPRMAPLYWAEPDKVHPALYARASMSVPLLFEPFRISGIPRGQEAWERWDRLANFHDDLPADCILVDGGIMSNFPIDVFHKPLRVPVAPTFGAKLGTQQRSGHAIKSATALCQAVFNSARHCLDFDFVTRNPDYTHLVQCIDTGDHDWLNFGLSDEEKFDLFARGARAAEQFLRRFRWERYKVIRKELAEAFSEDHNYATTRAEASA